MDYNFNYSNPENQQNGNHTPANKNRRGYVAVVLLCLCFTVIGSIVGGSLVMFMNRDVSDNTIIAETDENGNISLVTDDGASSDGGSGTSENGEKDDMTGSSGLTLKAPALNISKDNTSSLSASEIYDANVGRVVGITAEGTTTNIFGQQSRTASSGTGFIITSDGYILTNYHVIEGSSTCTVSLYNGEAYDATVVGFDEENDIAVLQINADYELIPVTIGDSDTIRVGADIAVIGNPLGELTYTMTKGIISALDREINTDGTPIAMFQIDAAVNSGNSGGPAFDEYGNVVGIVTAKYASESIEGLGFCIPINDAVAVATDLIEYGYVRGRPDLGVDVDDGYSVYAYYYFYYGRHSSRLSNLLDRGVYVSSVTKNGPADEAGLEIGDYITAIDGNEIADINAYEAYVNALKPDDEITLTVYRKGESFEVKLTVAEYVPSGLVAADTKVSGL